MNCIKALPVRIPGKQAIRLKMLVLALLTSAMAGPAAAQSPCQQGKEAETWIRRANDTAGAPQDRSVAFQRAIQLCPTDGDLYERYSSMLLENHDVEAALDWIHRGLRVDSKGTKLKLNLAVAMLASGKASEALEELKQIPPVGANEFYLGMAYRTLRDHKRAREAFSKAIEAGYPDPYVFYVLIEQDRSLEDKEAGMLDFATFNARFPDSPWLHVLLGDAHLSRSEDSSAESEYQEALNQDPNIPVLQFQLGYIAFKRADYSQAADHFRKEIAIDPGFSEAYLYLGAALHRLGKTSDAIPFLEQAVAREPTTALAYRELAVAQSSASRPDAEEHTLREGIERFPREAALHAQLARLLAQTGRDREARQEADLAESLGRRNNPPRDEAKAADALIQTQMAPPEGTAVADQSPLHSAAQSLADTRRCLDRRDAACAAKVLDEITDSAAKDSPDYLELKSRALALVRKKEEALAAIGLAIQKAPKQAHYFITQGSFYQEFGDQVSAIQSYVNAQKLDPESPVPMYLIAMSFCALGAYYNQNDYYHRAERHFEAALKLDPKYDKAEFMRAVVDEILSQTDESRRHFERAIELQPDNPYYHLHYGILMSRLGNNTVALHEMQMSEKLDSSYALTHLNLGSLYSRMQDYVEARKQLEKAVQLNPKLPAAYYNLGSVYHHLSLDNESRSAYEQFQKMKTREQQEATDPAERLISSPSPGTTGNHP